jgi:DNA-binding IclR family transcriptional regulator
MDSVDDHTVTGRILAVLDAVADLGEAATLAAMTRSTGIPKPTVRRIASDLCARGVLQRHDDTYHLGPRLLELGARAAKENSLRLTAAYHIRDLFARTGEIVWVSTITDTAHVLVDSAFGTSRTADMRQPWPARIRSMRFLATAAGRILLADRPELAEELAAQPLVRPTPYSVSTWRGLFETARAARDNGLAIEHEQSLLGYNCIAAGLRGPDRRVIGFVGVTGRAHAMNPRRLTKPLLAAIHDIERNLKQANDFHVGASWPRQ